MEWRLWLIPAIAALIGLAAGWGIGRWWGPRAVWWLAGTLGLLAVGLILAARAAQGMEGLGYVVLALFMAAPAGLGAVLAGLWHRWRR